jgi:5-methylcytosine-specific restriction endonuclease McrA
METTTSPFENYREYWDCRHPETAIRWRIRRNGVGCWAVQCLYCGNELRAVAKSSPEARQIAERVPFDEDLAKQIQAEFKRESEARMSEWQAQIQQQKTTKEQESADWWRWYNEYLKTPQWKQKHDMVIKRAGGLCEGCGQRKAVQVHHKTYDHAGNELLFELVAICYQCHCILHPHMQETAA